MLPQYWNQKGKKVRVWDVMISTIKHEMLK